MKTRLIVALVVAATAAIGAASAQERTAKLSDPALSAQNAEPAARETQTPPSASATSYFSSVEVEAIRAAVRGEIHALAARDAHSAFAYLAPTSQSYYADAKRFLNALKASMPPLLAIESFAMAETERDSVNAVQTVVLTSTDGSQWLARFTVERQPDGGWGIKRCLVEAAAGKPSA